MSSEKIQQLKERLDYYKRDDALAEQRAGKPDCVDEYRAESDWRVRENANSGFCYQSCINHVAGTYIAKHTLDKELPKELADLHRSGMIHIHDLSNGIVGYCAGWSLMDLLMEGFHGGEGSARAKPARHFDTALSQLLNFFITLQGEWAGAQAVSSFDTFLAPFVWVDNLSLKDVRQSIQRFIFMLNTGVRLGQTPFTNITLDWTIPEHLQKVPAIIGGEPHPEKTYGDFQKEVDMINRAFLEVMEAGDADGRIFTFPIPTYNITKDFDWNSDNAKYLFRVTGKYGTPYFANYINSSMDPKDIRSMAFLFDQKFIYKEQGKIKCDLIKTIYDNWKVFKLDTEILMHGKFVPVKEFFEISYDHYDKYVEVRLSNGYVQRFSYAHKCYVARDGQYQIIESQNVRPGDEFVLSAKPWGIKGSDTDELAGEVFGMFLLYGQLRGYNTEVVYEIPAECETYIPKIFNFFLMKGIEIKLGLSGNNRIITIQGNNFKKYIEPFVDGLGFFTNAFWNTSDLFREGVWRVIVADRMNDNDGDKLCQGDLCIGDEDLFILAGSLGKILDVTPVIEKNGTKKEYTIAHHNIGGYMYHVEVATVRLRDTQFKTVYNFEVDTPDHLVELPNGIITHQCCRLRLELDKLEHRGGGLFGSGEKTGSIGVVTLNLPRLAYLASKSEGDKEENFFNSLEDLIYDAITILEIKRKVVKENFDLGLMPYSRVYLQTLDNHFSTIGTIGMNEMCLNLLGKDIGTTEGRDFALKVLDFINARLLEAQSVTSTHLNLEGVPGEGTSYRLAKQDKALYPDIITAGDEVPYYTNSSYLPVNYTDDIFEVMDHQDALQCKYTSGTVVHAFLGESVDDPEVMANLTRKVFSRYHFPYLTWTPTFSICPVHGYIHGKHETCPMDN